MNLSIQERPLNLTSRGVGPPLPHSEEPPFAPGKIDSDLLQLADRSGTSDDPFQSPFMSTSSNQLHQLLISGAGSNGLADIRQGSMIASCTELGTTFALLNDASHPARGQNLLNMVSDTGNGYWQVTFPGSHLFSDSGSAHSVYISQDELANLASGRVSGPLLYQIVELAIAKFLQENSSYGKLGRLEQDPRGITHYRISDQRVWQLLSGAPAERVSLKYNGQSALSSSQRQSFLGSLRHGDTFILDTDPGDGAHWPADLRTYLGYLDNHVYIARYEEHGGHKYILLLNPWDTGKRYYLGVDTHGDEILGTYFSGLSDLSEDLPMISA